jgi:hypothetical protein
VKPAQCVALTSPTGGGGAGCGPGGATLQGLQSAFGFGHLASLPFGSCLRLFRLTGSVAGCPFVGFGLPAGEFGAALQAGRLDLRLIGPGAGGISGILVGVGGRTQIPQAPLVLLDGLSCGSDLPRALRGALTGRRWLLVAGWDLPFGFRLRSDEFQSGDVAEARGRRQLPLQTSTPHLFTGLRVDGSGFQCPIHRLPVERRVPLRLPQRRVGLLSYATHHLASPSHGLAEAAVADSGQQPSLCSRKCIADLVEGRNPFGVPVGQLVDRPSRHAGPPQPFDLVCSLPVARCPQPFHQVVALRHELLRREAVQPINLSVDVHGSSRCAGAGEGECEGYPAVAAGNPSRPAVPLGLILRCGGKRGA